MTDESPPIAEVVKLDESTSASLRDAILQSTGEVFAFLEGRGIDSCFVVFLCADPVSDAPHVLVAGTKEEINTLMEGWKRNVAPGERHVTESVFAVWHKLLTVSPPVPAPTMKTVGWLFVNSTSTDAVATYSQLIPPSIGGLS